MSVTGDRTRRARGEVGVSIARSAAIRSHSSIVCGDGGAIAHHYAVRVDLCNRAVVECCAARRTRWPGTVAAVARGMAAAVLHVPCFALDGRCCCVVSAIPAEELSINRRTFVRCVARGIQLVCGDQIFSGCLGGVHIGACYLAEATMTTIAIAKMMAMTRPAIFHGL